MNESTIALLISLITAVSIAVGVILTIVRARRDGKSGGITDKKETANFAVTLQEITDRAMLNEKSARDALGSLRIEYDKKFSEQDSLNEKRFQDQKKEYEKLIAELRSEIKIALGGDLHISFIVGGDPRVMKEFRIDTILSTPVSSTVILPSTVIAPATQE